jgi:hypothetical protein
MDHSTNRPLNLSSESKFFVQAGWQKEFSPATTKVPIRRNTMNRKSRLAAIALVAAIGAATPAVAFAANHAQLYRSSPRQSVPYRQNADRANGLGAYARVPGPESVTPSDPVNNPVTSGGGSMGYNKYMGHAH